MLQCPIMFIVLLSVHIPLQATARDLFAVWDIRAIIAYALVKIVQLSTPGMTGAHGRGKEKRFLKDLRP